MHKYRHHIIMGVVFCFVILLVGCGGKAPNIQVSPTKQTEPEVQITQTPQDNFQEYWVRPADEMTMVFIPGGTFQMGSTQAEIEEAIELCQEHYHICNRWYYERESPIHSVSQDSYWIDQTEVSNSQYRLCVDAGECAEPARETARRLQDRPAGPPQRRGHPEARPRRTQV